MVDLRGAQGAGEYSSRLELDATEERWPRDEAPGDQSPVPTWIVLVSESLARAFETVSVTL